ncbi:MAG: AAA family ATPase [Sedimentisphaerales bacterium]|nr:AAA family ATPase [Sedimentisphaerales bacterium]
MKAALNKISIQGFKSIRSLMDFPLGKLNVIVGGNGAGKSNFVDFFRMLRAMSEEGLTAFVTQKGGADGFFFGGPRETKEINCYLVFGQNQYHFSLEPTVDGLMVKKEGVYWEGNKEWHYMGGGRLESGLNKWKDKPSSWGKWPSIEAHVSEAVSSWTVYHFHDTSMTSLMRREHSIRDYRSFLRPSAENIAAYLFHIRNRHVQRYERIVSVIQLVAPFFDDFLLEPEKKGENEVIKLEWRQKGSSFPFQPSQFSDGTIRFICLATALLQPNLPSTIIVDEPELGLHPFALDVLAGLMKEASEQTQLIVATQSVTLLNHFEPQDVIVVDRETGASVFKRLDVESLGSWLEEYSMGELWQKNIIDGGPSCE